MGVLRLSLSTARQGDVSLSLSYQFGHVKRNLTRKMTSETQMMPGNSDGHLITAKCLLCSTVELIVLLPIFLLELLTNPCYAMACSHF